MSTNAQVAATSPRWDYGYFEDLLKNPRQPLPDLNEARPHISLLFCVLHKKRIPEMAKVSKLAFPSRPCVPARNRSEAFEEHEKKCHLMNLDYFTTICNELEKNLYRFARTWNNEALELVSREVPILRSLISIVQRIVEPSRAAPFAAAEDPYVPLPPTTPPPVEQYTHLPVTALFSLRPEEEEQLKDIPILNFFTTDISQNAANGTRFPNESTSLAEVEQPDLNQNFKSANEVLHETNAFADDPYTPASFSSIHSSSSSSSIISSYSLDWKMDLSFDPFAKCELPRLTEELNEEPSSLFQFEMNTDGAAFKMSSTVVNANTILEMCICRKKEDEESKKRSENTMDQLIKEIPLSMTDEISEILLQISISTEAAKMC